MNSPHISPVPTGKREEQNSNQNDVDTIGLGKRFRTTNKAIGPEHWEERQNLVHPYKFNNFRNEKVKDITCLENDPCLARIDYGRFYNRKDRKYRGNDFGVRYDYNGIFNRPKYYFQYNNSRMNKQFPQIAKHDPWFAYNWGKIVNPDIGIINNRQDVYNNWWESAPYFYYRDQVNEGSCEKPIFTMPHFLEGFENYNDKAWMVYLLIPIILVILVRYLRIKK
jgi:hypothetical protein